MLAEDIGGWIFVGGVLLAGFATSLLALIAIIPARKGKRAFTLLLAAPAFVVGVSATIWCVHGYMRQSPADSNYNPTPDFIFELLIVAAPALATSLLAVTVLWYKRRRQI